MNGSLLKIVLSSLALIFILINCTGPTQLPANPTAPLIGENLEEVIKTQNQLLAQNPNDAIAHYLLAVAFLKQKNYSQAEQHIKQATQLAPLNGAYFELLGEITFHSERYAISGNALKSAIQLQPDLLSAYLKLALVYEKGGENERGIATLEEGINREPRYVEALYHLARLNLKQREYEAARDAVNSGLILEPNNQEMLLLRIRILSEQGNYYHAKTLTDQFLEKYPQSYQAQHERLKILFAQQEWDAALQLIEALRQNHTIRLQDHLIHAQILTRQNQLDQAKVLLEDLLKRHRLRAEIMIELASLLIQKGNLEQALIWLNRSLEIDDQQPQAHFLQASIFFKFGDFLHGDLALNRVLALAPLNQTYQLLALRRHLMKGEFNEVEQQLEELQKKDFLDPEILRLQADLFALRGQYNKAENLIRQIQLIQDNDILHFSLARVLYFKQQYQTLLAITEPLIKKYPNDWESAYLHAAALHRLGQFAKALKVLSPFLQQKKGEGFIHYLVGDFYRYQRDEKRAQETYLGGLEVFPRNVYLVEALSASYLVEQKWELARDMIEKVLEQEHPLKAILLDRLVYISYQLKAPQQALHYLQRYHQINDPVLKALDVGMEKRLLFPVASPVLGYSGLASPLPIAPLSPPIETSDKP